MSLRCKLVPVQYREYECHLLNHSFSKQVENPRDKASTKREGVGMGTASWGGGSATSTSRASTLALASSSFETLFTHPTIEEMRENSGLSPQWPIKTIKVTLQLTYFVRLSGIHVCFFGSF